MNLDVDIWDLLIIGGLIYLGSRVVNAAKTISREVKRFANYGLTTEEDEKARAIIEDPKASTPDKLAAIATLRTKVETAKAAGYGAQVATAATALDLYEKELRKQDELAPLRAAWQAKQKPVAK